MIMPPHKKIFDAIFSENIAFIEKIVRWKIIQNLISHKNVIFNFGVRWPVC